MSIEEGIRTTIRSLLAVHGESQRDLARSIGTSFQTLSMRLNGKSRIQLTDLEAIAAHWDLEAADLMRGPSYAIDAAATRRAAKGDSAA